MMSKSDRSKYQTASILLKGEEQQALAYARLMAAPLDPDKPLEFLLREQVKGRKMDQNALMWAGPLRDISEQAWVEGRQFSAEVWHQHFKEVFLPEEFDAEQTKEGYAKWGYTPSGKRILVGSTSQLTVHGFSIYLQQIEAYGANLGVMFHANPRENRL